MLLQPTSESKEVHRREQEERKKVLEGTVSSAAEQSQAQITHYSHV